MAVNQDTYQPAAPDTAECPHCGAVVPSLAYPSPGLGLATLGYRCLSCEREWHELRGRNGARRIWELDPTD